MVQLRVQLQLRSLHREDVSVKVDLKRQLGIGYLNIRIPERKNFIIKFYVSNRPEFFFYKYLHIHTHAHAGHVPLRHAHTRTCTYTHVHARTCTYPSMDMGK